MDSFIFDNWCGAPWILPTFKDLFFCIKSMIINEPSFVRYNRRFSILYFSGDFSVVKQEKSNKKRIYYEAFWEFSIQFNHNNKMKNFSSHNEIFIAVFRNERFSMIFFFLFLSISLKKLKNYKFMEIHHTNEFIKIQ